MSHCDDCAPEFAECWNDGSKCRKRPQGSFARPAGSAQWQGMECAPKNSRWIEIETSDGKVHRAHYACDLSGEEQPPFEGFFVAVVSDRGKTLYFKEVPGKPVRWRETAQNEKS